MNFIMISPFFPHNFQSFATRLNEQGIRVLGIGTEPYDQLGERLHHSLTEYYKVNNLEDYGEVARAVAFFYFKYGKIDRIESHNEYWLELDAYLRTEFNVPGLNSKDLETVKYKSKMKKLFKEAGAPVVEGYVAYNNRDIDKIIKDLSFPVVAKPDNGVGTSGTYRLDNTKDVEEFKNKWNEGTPYFIEEFVENGVLCAYDGLIDSNGEIAFDTTFNYSIPTLDAVETGIDFYYIVERDIDPKLREIGRKIVKTFGHKERFFHIEFFRMPGGSYITLEYNGRVAGGFTIDVYNYTYSIDLYNEYANIIQGKRFKGSNIKPSSYGVAISRRYNKEYQHSIGDIRNKYGENVKMVDNTPEALRDLLGDIFIIITSNNEEEVGEIVEFVNK